MKIFIQINIDSLVETITVEKPGFINFKINIQKFLKVFFSEIDEVLKISDNTS